MTYDLTCQYPTNPDSLVFFQDADIDRSVLLHAYYQYIINNRFDEAKEYFNNSDLHGYNASFLNMIETRLRNVEENIDTVLGNEIPLVLHQDEEPTGSYVTPGFNWVGKDTESPKPIIIKLETQYDSNTQGFVWDLTQYENVLGPLTVEDNIIMDFEFNDHYNTVRKTIPAGSRCYVSGTTAKNISITNHKLYARLSDSSYHDIIGYSVYQMAMATPYIVYPNKRRVGLIDLGDFGPTYSTTHNYSAVDSINMASRYSRYAELTTSNFIMDVYEGERNQEYITYPDETNWTLYGNWDKVIYYYPNTGQLYVGAQFGNGDHFVPSTCHVFVITKEAPLYDYNNWQEGL